jgi:hypothetical protein
MLVHFHAPLGQEIERRHGPREAGAEVGPHAMADFLAMEGRGQHRQHGFHQHPRVLGAPRTDFHVGRVAGRGMETGIGLLAAAVGTSDRAGVEGQRLATFR